MTTTTAATARRFVRAHRQDDRESDWSGVYVGAAAVLLLLTLGGLQARRAAERLFHATAFDATRSGVGLVLAVLGLVLLLRLVCAVGPVAVSSPDARWLLLTPLSRRGVLGRTFMVVSAAAVVAGIVVAVASLAMVGLPGDGPVRVACVAVSGAAYGASVAAFAALVQPSTRVRSTLSVLTTVVLVLAGGVGLAMAGWSGWPGHGVVEALRDLPVGAVVGLSVLSVAIAVILQASAWRRLADFPVAAVVGASLRWAATTRLSMGLQPALLARAAEDRYWRGRRLRSRPWPSLRGAAALAWQEWRMLGRRPSRIAALVASSGLPALVVVATGARMAGMVVLFCGALLVPGSGTAGLRRDASSPASRRLLGVDRPAMLRGRALLPGLLGALWLMLAMELMARVHVLPSGPWWLLAVGAGPALAVAALRMAQRGPIDHSSIPVLAPMGMAWLPTGWLVWAFTGLDLAVPGCAGLLWVLTTPDAAVGQAVWIQALTGCAVGAMYLLFVGRRLPGFVAARMHVG